MKNTLLLFLLSFSSFFYSFGQSKNSDTSFTNFTLADSVIKFLKFKKTEKVVVLTVPLRVFLKSADSLAPDNDTFIVFSQWERNRFKIKKQAKRVLKEANSFGISLRTATVDSSKIKVQLFETAGIPFAWVWIPYKKNKKEVKVRFTSWYLGNSWYLYNEIVFKE